MPPDDQDADAIHEGDQQQLGRHRIAQPEGRGDGGIEARHGALRNQLALEELLEQGTHALVHHQLGDDQQGHRQQEPDVHLGVVDERHRHARSPRLTLQSREHQQRQPADHRDGHHALAQMRQRVVGQMRAAQELEQRPAQDEREVRRIVEQSFAWRSRAGFHLQSLLHLCAPDGKHGNTLQFGINSPRSSQRGLATACRRTACSP